MSHCQCFRHTGKNVLQDKKQPLKGCLPLKGSQPISKGCDRLEYLSSVGACSSGCSSSKKKPLLEIQEVRVDIGFSSGKPKAVFSLGKCFACTDIKVKAEIEVDSSSVVKKTFCLKTDKSGKYCFPLPLNTTSVSTVVHVGCVSVRGKYGVYQAVELEWRTYDGSANNLISPSRGAVGEALLRLSPVGYADGVGTLAVRGPNNPNPRVVSNNICKISGSGDGPLSSVGLSDMVWVWGQFLDHEIDLTGGGSETADITTPLVADDPEEDYPNRTISFTRSAVVSGSGVRQQPNQISAFIDATNVYGYGRERAYVLRRLDGSGKLVTGLADNSEVLMPYNVGGEENAMPDGSVASDFFLAGDIRANENIFLTGMHTLFVREHNRLCERIAGERPAWAGKDELIYQHARRWVSGLMQNITYREFLPALLGAGALGGYGGYSESVDAGVATEFSTVGYRLGHSMLSSVLQTGADAGSTILLRDAFFSPAYVQSHGVDDLLIGASKKKMQEIDRFVVDDVRSFLFGPPTATHLLDLASLNIQRGRDHGISGYNDVREAYGLARLSTFGEVTSDGAVASKLASLYVHPDHMDPWIGCLVEDHVVGAGVGELLMAILVDQFGRLRSGDRFWFENDGALSAGEKAEIRATRLSDVILRNTGLSGVSGDVFRVV